MESPDRVPKERYYDPEFFRLEAESLWPRVWQMACRLEEIPEAGDFVEYECLDQSIIVLRADDTGSDTGADIKVRAFQNACRHRGVTIVDGRGHCERGFQCPFHGWRYGLDGKNAGVTQRRTFADHNLQPGDIDLVPVRCEVLGGCAWINLDADAPPLRECLEPFASALDAWKAESLRTEKWFAARLAVNWKLAIEAFVEMYHVVQTHPQLVIPTRFGRPDAASFDPRAFIDADIRYLRAMSEGMAGMVPASDVRIAETLRATQLPADPVAATATWNGMLNDAVTTWHRDRGATVPDLNELDAQGLNLTFFHGFPHYFVLPMYSGASAYRFRPLGPEETLMEIWSLERCPEGMKQEPPSSPDIWECDDPRWPPIPAQDFSNLPRQQRGLHARGLRVHAFVRWARGPYLELRAHDRRLSRGARIRTAAPGAAIGQRLSLRQTDRRPRILRPGASRRPVPSAPYGPETVGGWSRRSMNMNMNMNTTFSDVAEGVRATIAAYTQALDDGRTDDVVATFCPDGVCDIPGMGTHTGHDALRAAYSAWKPTRAQRHLVVNTLVTDWNDHEANAISDVIFVLLGKDGWRIQVVGRYRDLLHCDDGTWRFHRRSAEFVQ